MSIKLLLQHDDVSRTLVLNDGNHVLGTGEGADARVRLPTISRVHARLDVEGHEVRITDLGSSNGTRIDERRVGRDEPAAWAEGALARIGQVRARWVPLDAGDDEAALLLAAPTAPAPTSRSTLSDAQLDDFTRSKLVPLLDELFGGQPLPSFARSLGESLFASLPLDALRLGFGDTVLFEAGSVSGESSIDLDDGELVLRAWPRQDQRVAAILPVAEAAIRMLRLSAPALELRGEPSEPRFPKPETLDTAMRKLYRGALRASEGRLNILIHGESGTGKEVLARELHAQGPLKDGPFVALNCAALPEDLLESELFGIERGVATGVDARPGKFELADGGILFLDEIGDMPPATQARILRVLQEGEVVRLGASAPRRISVQVVSATNQNLKAMVEAGDFRLDLYHRLADWEAVLPPLRNRPADIPNLALFFLDRYARELERSVRGLSRRAVDALLTYRWPGNVRELEREMKRLAAFADPGQLLTSEDLAPRILGDRTADRSASGLVEALADEERRLIRQALARADGNASRAAEALGISRATLYRRFSDLGIKTS